MSRRESIIRCLCPIGGSRRACGACQASSRRAEQSSRHGQQAGGQASVPVGGGRARADYPAALSSARLEAAAGPAGQAAVPAGRGRAWPGFETTRQANDQQPSAGGVEAAAGPAGQASVPVGGGRDRADYPTALSTARLEAAAGPAGPGRASRRRAERSSRRGRRAGRQAPRRPEIRRCHKPRPKVRTPRSTPGSGRPDDRRGDRGR